MFAQFIMLIYSESLTLGKVSNLAELIAVASKDNEKKTCICVVHTLPVTVCFRE